MTKNRGLAVEDFGSLRYTTFHDMFTIIYHIHSDSMIITNILVLLSSYII